MGPASITLYKRLASLISKRNEQHYSQVLQWMRCRLNFSFLRFSIKCLRGAHSTYHHAICNLVIVWTLVTQTWPWQQESYFSLVVFFFLFLPCMLSCSFLFFALFFSCVMFCSLPVSCPNPVFFFLYLLCLLRLYYVTNRTHITPLS